MVLAVLKKWSAAIYDYFISAFLTVISHLVMFQHMTPMKGWLLDVGCGTGAPLKAILPGLRRTYDKIVGLDLDPLYTHKARQALAGEAGVTIETLDFYRAAELKTQFDFVLFSFSFMLMPDRLRALEIAKSITRSHGRIGFILTLNKTDNKILEILKPLIKNITTIDFGQVVYESQFLELLKIAGLKVSKKERITCPYSLILRLASVYYVEVETGINKSLAQASNNSL